MRIKYNGAIKASSDKDYASLKGTDFDKAKAILTKDGYKEHEYGDKDDNNGYAVYRKGDKEVELTYEWIKGKRNGEAHAGKVLDVYVDDNINGACGGKKAVKAAYDNEDIVMYWDGQKVYEGPADSDMTREIVWFLDDPEKLQEIVDYCNSFGDPVIEDTSNLMDVAATFVEMVDYELKEANSIDDDVYISDEAGHFEIFKKSDEVTGAKKSVKCSTDGKIPYDLVSMLVALRDYADVSDAYVNDEHGKLVDIADSLYNVGRDVIEKMKPEFKKVYEKYGSDYFDKVLDDVSALDSQLTRNNVNDLIVDYEDRANNFNGVEGACGGKKSVKASRRAIMAGPGAGYTIKWNLESIKSINSFNVTNVSEPDQYGLITAEADCDVDITVEIVEAYSYYYGIDSPLNDVPAKMTKVKFEIDPEQWPEIGSLYDADVAFAEELLNNEIYDVVSNGEVMYGGGWTHSTWDGTLTDYDHDDLIEVKVTDEEIIQYVDDAVSGALEPAYDEDEYDEYDEVEESKRINSALRSGNMKIHCNNSEKRPVTAAADITNMKIFTSGTAYVDIYEDSYEQGELGYVQTWDFPIGTEFDSAEELIKNIASSASIFSDDIRNYLVSEDGMLYSDAMVNVDNEEPDEAEMEAWRRGELTLYNAHLGIALKVGSGVHEMTYDEAEAFGFDTY